MKEKTIYCVMPYYSYEGYGGPEICFLTKEEAEEYIGEKGYNRAECDVFETVLKINE